MKGRGEWVKEKVVNYALLKEICRGLGKDLQGIKIRVVDDPICPRGEDKEGKVIFYYKIDKMFEMPKSVKKKNRYQVVDYIIYSNGGSFVIY